MHVVMIAAEVAPYAKVGGLADVVGALPLQLEKLGVTVSVVIPRYRSIDLRKYDFKPYPIAEHLDFDVQSSVMPHSSVRVFLIGIDRFFDRDGIYIDALTGLDYPDQADRWIAFQRSALEFVRVSLLPVDILHCHDHQVALIPAYLRKQYSQLPGFAAVRSCLTIHNLGYQGIFAREAMSRSGFAETEFYPGSPFEYHGKLNFLKVGIAFADLVTTVSPTYAREIQEIEALSFGLMGVLHDRPDPMIGILNGIDYNVWNPKTDPLIPSHFDAQSYESLLGKLANKRALLNEFGLDETRLDKPLLAMVSRIDVQKGFDLLTQILDDVLARDVSFVLLGTGDRKVEHSLREIVSRHPRRAAMRFSYQEALSHLVIAGADIFLMPSKYEPCGLTQIYSMRYGTIPVVRSTGGLADTVREFDSNSGKGTGFTFTAYDAGTFRAAIDRALQAWENRALWKTIMRNGMSLDFSWTRSAHVYREAFEELIAHR